MSRLDDLIDLVQTTNEVYFITAPGRVRTAFILADDIVELALKTFLQEKAVEQREQCIQYFEQQKWVSNERQRKTLHRYFEEEIDENEACSNLGRNPATNRNAVTDFQKLIDPYPMIRHWSANQPEARKEFRDVVNEVKQFFPPLPGHSSHPATALLDEALHRHQTRNKFYHDHQQTGLTIDDDKCLRALCGLFDLLEQLFSDWRARVHAYKTVGCQVGVLRLKKAALGGQQDLVQPYNEALDQLKRDHHYDIERRSVEHSLVHTVSDRFFRALREQFQNRIAALQTRIHRIQQMARPSAEHRAELADKQHLLETLQRQFDEISALLGTP